MAMPEARGGGLGLPTGFRFMPTDEELTASYLRKKGTRHTGSNFSSAGRCQGAGAGPAGCYPARRHVEGDREGGACGHLTAARDAHGHQQTLVFFTVNVGSGATRRTQWIMHEYRLHPALLAVVAKVGKDVEDSVVCRFFKKATRRGGNPEDMGGPSSPHLSCVTEELGDDEEEMASSNN
ncbi:NAC domain-containing protein 76 [Brachypodium distachyon]|uniref:NAC domain-containing protein 76 n=1 Tax=Brachypodium distachyon TaxID=15368 RepID=UPI00052FE57B|nr:NAC domain-containing protein 76 [Brachypodium distachyon]|eukprot:XP_010239224.1 NAC domain-containing protein 76 [Brachypodium distachyon]